MAVFNEKPEELERYEFMMGMPRGRLTVTMDIITDAMALKKTVPSQTMLF